MDALEYMVCPSCLSELEIIDCRVEDNEILEGTFQCVNCKLSFNVKEGFLDLTFPPQLHKRDEEWRNFYDEHAVSYDEELIDAVVNFGKLFGVKDREEARSYIIQGRETLVESLNLEKGFYVLDVATGTGDFIPLIYKRIGEDGLIEGLDISMKMLQVARRKASDYRIKRVNLTIGNAAFLPYKSETFDAVLHMGGINTFGDIKRALKEMVRVAKVGSKIVICDEGLSPDLRETPTGKMLISLNRLFESTPPVEYLPSNVRDIKLYWIWSDLFYVIEFVKSS